MSAFVIWALVAATAVFWALRQFSRGPVAPAYTVPISESTAVRGDLGRLLGTPPAAPVAAVAAAPEISTRFHLVGVVAPRSDRPADGGVAVIAIDGKPGRAFRVGATVDGPSGLQLRSVAQRGAAIASGDGATSFTLELPLRVAAATGTLPAVSMTSPDALAGGAARAMAPNAVPPRPDYMPGPRPTDGMPPPGMMPPPGDMSQPGQGFPPAGTESPTEQPPQFDQNGQPIR